MPSQRFKVCKSLEGFKGLEGFKRLRAGKRQTWTPMPSQPLMCGVVRCLLAAG